MSYTVAFWGVRGSIPTPGSETMRYGGNTACVSVERDDQDGSQVLVFDAGTGIRRLGNELVDRANGKLMIDLLISHTHWDHIQGFPYFFPAFVAGNKFEIYHIHPYVPNVLENQMTSQVFPAQFSGLEADIEFHQVEEGQEITLGDLKITA